MSCFAENAGKKFPQKDHNITENIYLNIILHCFGIYFNKRLYAGLNASDRLTVTKYDGGIYYFRSGDVCLSGAENKKAVIREYRKIYADGLPKL